MASKKHNPGCPCCESGCVITSWADLTELKQHFEIIGDEDAVSLFASEGRISPGSTMISKGPVIDPASWIFQQVIEFSLDHNLGVRWIAHAAPDYTGDLGDYVFAELRPLAKPTGSTAAVEEDPVVRIDIGHVSSGVETILDSTWFYGGLGVTDLGRHGRLCFVERPTRGRFEKLIDTDDIAFSQGDPSEQVVNTLHLGYGPVAAGRDFPSPGSFYTFDKAVRVYEKTTGGGNVDTATAPFLDVGSGQALRRWGVTTTENLLIANCTVVDISAIEMIKILSFNRNQGAIATPSSSGLTVSGATLPATLPSGGYVGVQVIDRGYATADPKPLVKFPTERSFVSRSRNRFNPDCPYCNTQRSNPCVGVTELSSYAGLTTTINLLDVIKEVSGEIGEPDVLSESSEITWNGAGGFTAIRATYAEWDGWAYRAEERVEVAIERHPVRSDQFRLDFTGSIKMTLGAGVVGLYAKADGSVGDMSDDDLNTVWDYLLFDLNTFNCAYFSIDLDYELGPGAVDGSAIDGKKWTLASL